MIGTRNSTENPSILKWQPHSEAWGQEKPSRSENAALGVVGEFREQKGGKPRKVPRSAFLEAKEASKKLQLR